jgi:hypothetical protein
LLLNITGSTGQEYLEANYYRGQGLMGTVAQLNNNNNNNNNNNKTVSTKLSCLLVGTEISYKIVRVQCVDLTHFKVSECYSLQIHRSFYSQPGALNCIPNNITTTRPPTLYDTLTTNKICLFELRRLNLTHLQKPVPTSLPMSPFS